MSRPATRLVIAATMLLPIVVGAPASAGPSGGALPPVLIEQLRVADRYGVPADAAMVAANVTAVTPADAGHITVFPCDEDVPATSNINYVAEAIAPNLTVTRISDVGTICVATHAVTDVIVDIVGYVPAGSGISALANPVRFLDSRDGGSAPIPAGTTTEIPIAGVSGVDTGADVVLFNLTAIGFDRPGHLTAFPCGEPLPETSSVNYAPSQVVPNLITSRIGENGSVCVHNLAPAEIIVDVAAFATSGITPLPNPVRMVDTRATAPTAADGVLTLDVVAHPGVPESATAAVYNLTSVGSTAPGFATSYPCDIDLPVVSNLNYGAGQVVANGTITKLSAAGELCIYTLAQTDLIVDLIGYSEGIADYVPLTPERIWDSREGWQRTCDWLIVNEGGSARDGVSIFNVVTGEVRRLALGMTTSSPLTRPTLSFDCRAVVTAHLGQVYELFVDGGRRRTPIDPSVETGFPVSVHAFGETILWADESGGLTDVETGDQIWDGARPSEPLDQLDVSANGIVAFSHVSPMGTGVLQRVEVWDARTDEMLFGTDLDGASRIRLSPDGRYITVHLPNRVLVLTIFGDVVDGIDAPVDLDAHFGGPGELLLCANSNGMFTWALHGPIEQQLTWTEMNQALGAATCALSQ